MCPHLSPCFLFPIVCIASHRLLMCLEQIGSDIVLRVLNVRFDKADSMITVCDCWLFVEEVVEGTENPTVFLEVDVLCDVKETVLFFESSPLFKRISFHCFKVLTCDPVRYETARRNCNSLIISSSSSSGTTVRDGGVSLKPTSCKPEHLQVIVDRSA